MANGEPDFIIKRNDFGDLEPLKAKLERLKVDQETGEPEVDGEGNEVYEPVDLTGCTVRVLLESRVAIDGEIRKIKTSPATGLNGEALDNTGWIEYHFEPAGEADPVDLAYAGDFDMEFEITGPEDKALATVPNSGYYYLKVEADKGP
jgi:hypothetical protein